MPLPKEWIFKPTIVAYPYSYNNTIVCHNCFMSWRKEIINPCNGLCTTCVKENPVQVQKAGRSLGEGFKINCCKCFQAVNRTNFGICREVCESCKADQPPLRQRCICCDKYDDNCWNNICINCRSGELIFCTFTGCFYRDWPHHNGNCWCLIYK